MDIPCDVIDKNFTSTERNNAINATIDYYYKTGFPYYKKDMNKLLKDYRRVLASPIKHIEIGDELQQNMAGLYFINCFHPEMWSVVCNKAKTPMDIYENRELFYSAIDKRISLSDSPLRRFNIRKSLKVFSGAQSVSNFRPTIAKYIYDKYCKKNNRVLDPCMGYGGRLMGAFCSENVNEYVGVDPCKTTCKNNVKLFKELHFIDGEMNSNMLFDFTISKKAEFINEPFEDVSLYGKFDLIFTSPPYFNIEKYSNDSTQSWVRYKTFDSWINNFLEKLIVKSHKHLMDSGFFIINIDGGKKLKDEFLKISSKMFTLVETRHMRLSKMIGTRKNKQDKFKLEPIYIFKKINSYNHGG